MTFTWESTEPRGTELKAKQKANGILGAAP